MMLAGTQRAEFEELGFVRIAGAFSPVEAAAMQELVWDELARVHGIRCSDRSSWRIPQPCGLQRITAAPVFAPIGGPAVRGAIDALLGAGTWQVPKRWGAILATFPVRERRWTVPSTLWHADFAFALPPCPLPGVKVFTFLSDVPARGGGTLVVEGSHRLVQRFVSGRPREKLQNTRQTRLAFLASQAWLRALASEASADDRVGRFMDSEEVIEGTAVKVVELTGEAGDVVLTQPWLLHCRAPNCADQPRFMRTIDIHRVRSPMR